MKETLAAIIGALVAGVITWLVSKRRPVYIECMMLYSGEFEALPGIKYTIKESVLDVFNVARFQFKNLGAVVIAAPVITLRLKDKIEIYGAVDSWYRGDERVVNSGHGGQQKGVMVEPQLSNIEAHGNVIAFKINALYPNQLNDECVVLDIFSDKKITEIEVGGQGVMSDGACWAVRYLEGSHSAWKDPIRITNRICMILLFAGVTAYCVMRRPWTIASIDSEAIAQLLRDRLAWGIILLFILWCCYLIYILEIGRYLYLPLPLLNRTLRLYLKKSR